MYFHKNHWNLSLKLYKISWEKKVQHKTLENWIFLYLIYNFLTKFSSQFLLAIFYLLQKFNTTDQYLSDSCRCINNNFFFDLWNFFFFNHAKNFLWIFLNFILKKKWKNHLERSKIIGSDFFFIYLNLENKLFL